MDIESIQLAQTISAHVTSAGIQRSIPVGGTSETSLTPDDADIIYGFSMTSGHANNSVKWTLDTHKLEFASGGSDVTTGLTCTDTVGAFNASGGEDGTAMLDANGAAIPTAVVAVAIYYELPADTATDSWVQATGTSADQADMFGTVKLISKWGSAGTGVRSALLVPRTACASDFVTFSFGQSGVKVNIVYLANTT